MLLGAVVGLGGAWVVMNRRWLANGMPASSADESEEADEDEEDRA